MPFKIVSDKITEIKADAVVITSNHSVPDDNGCTLGRARITKACGFPAKYVIHIDSSVRYGGEYNEEDLLSLCYTNCLKLAKEYDLESIAFPLLSTGVFGYPVDEAVKVAVTTIGNFLAINEMKVYLVVDDNKSSVLPKDTFDSIQEYIKYRSHYIKVEEREPEVLYDVRRYFIQEKAVRLIDVIEQVDETFSQMLLRLIDEKKMTDVQTYKRANIDRKLFSKIRNSKNYKPRKPTVIAFAIALRLDIDETDELLLKAGFALSPSSKFDLIIQYFIKEGKYDIFEINEALFAFGENLLGS